jgi:radical SAM protein with 4Fe4S-binding SPASM domain
MIKSLNYLLYRLKYRYARELQLTKPVDVSLELAAACQLACVFCYWNKPKEIPFKPGMMTWETAELILADAASIGVNSVKLNFRGESTLNPIFSRAAKFAKDHSNGSTFIDRLTNSNFMFNPNSEDIFEGLCNQTKVKVSFDSFIPEVLEKQRIKSNYDRIKKNIDIFYNHPLRKNTELVIQAVRTQLNKDEDIYGQSKKLWPEATISIREVVSGRVNNDIEKLENKKRDFNKRQPCIQASARLIFDWQGVAQVCCPDTGSKLQIGSIHDKSIYEIFNSKKAKEIREAHKNGKAFDLEPCKSCSSHESFSGYKHPWNS